jgi:hypothetical protein
MNYRKINGMEFVEWIGIILMFAFMLMVAIMVSSSRGTNDDLYEYLLETE